MLVSCCRFVDNDFVDESPVSLVDRLADNASIACSSFVVLMTTASLKLTVHHFVPTTTTAKAKAEKYLFLLFMLKNLGECMKKTDAGANGLLK